MNSETKFQGHSGQLDIDAPALWKLLNKVFNSEQLKILSYSYTARGEKPNDFEDLKLTRSPETNFNPFPARICNLILTKADGSSFNCAAACFLLGLCISIPGLEESMKLASSALLWPEIEEFSGEQLDLERLALAFNLDRARHLHMSTLAHEQQVSFYKRVKETIIPAVEFQEHSKLKGLLTSWTSLVRTRYT